MAVLGTAGHVDHGKTTLVRALTGVDTDRLPEEKKRGITIELGFAPLRVRDPDGRDGTERVVAVVDVPGHERFVGTMVGGAQGVDVALLVVAADAGVMPQTREHLAILAGLGVERLVVALTRCDAADDETRGLARIDVEDVLSRTPWAGAPIFEVSGKTGLGIDALRAAIAKETRALDLGPRQKRPARLAIDRAFVPRGQGVVVTGTLVAGSVSTGDELELVPSGRRVRVRGLHQHGSAVTKATATGRVAIGLGGVELADVHRGETLAQPGSIAVTRAFDAVLVRTGQGRPFGRRARITIHAGTDEVSGRLVPLGPLAEPEGEAPAKTTIGPGETWLVRAVLSRPVALAAGDRSVARADAPIAGIGTTVGSLEVLRVQPGKLAGGRARYSSLLRAWRAGDALARAKIEIDGAGLAGLAADELARRLPERAVPKEVARGLSGWELKSGGGTRWIGDAGRARVRQLLLAALDRWHAEHPDDEGAPLAVIVGSVPPNTAPGLSETTLEKAVSAGEVVRLGEKVRRASFKPRARADDPHALEIARRLREGGVAPPTLAEIARDLGVDPARARALATSVAGTGRIVHVQGDLWFDRAALDDVRARLVTFLKDKGAISTGEFKDLVGASRKFVVPLAEWFDAQKVTLRVGDLRKLRGA
ncbi:MAG: selenocysteine-specific translation elongation factor [Deltaproteobacteria bacterium]|nr:selenocysteine-specific translation elongation factor [Deltaproteobacteria bacterium]